MARTVSVSGAEAAAAKGGPVKAGRYIAEIIDAEEGAVKNGDNKGKPTLKVVVRITEGEEGVGRKVTDFNVPLFTTWASGKAAFKFYQFFGALGVKFPEGADAGDVDLPEDEDIISQEIGVVLDISENNPDFNEIKGYFEASKGLAAPKGAATSGAKGAAKKGFKL